jgi:KUP system potassium uptake protein
VLAVTGAEALYADMGHFGRRAITLGWLGLVLPACTLSYFGQGALVLRDESAVTAPFFLLTPQWAQIPMVLLATAATVIASEAVITGAFSVASQAARLGYLPRLRIEHTSAASIGQIYVPWINGVLMIAVLILVFAFRSSTALAYAFGMAVTGTITITTTLFFYYARTCWQWPLRFVLACGGSAIGGGPDVSRRQPHQARARCLAAAVDRRQCIHRDDDMAAGREIVTRARKNAEGPLREFVDGLVRDDPHAVIRTPSTAVFLNRGKETVPLAMRANVEHNHVLARYVIILTIDTEPVPRIPDADRMTHDDLGYADNGILHVTARFGYMEHPDVLAALALLDPTETDGHVDLARASYFLSKLELCTGPEPTMAPWRKRLFIATSHITADAAAHFGLPLNRTVIVGSRIEV